MNILLSENRKGKMSVKCPRCQHENPDDTLYCGKCERPLKSGEGISLTKTLLTPVEGLQKGSTFARRYTIVEELGRGGMGVVYKAEDTKLKRTVALKFLPPELTHIPEVKERFIREAQAAAALDHPNICTVYEFDEAEKTSFISIAYIEGQSLRTKVESGPLELDPTGPTPCGSQRSTLTQGKRIKPWIGWRSPTRSGYRIRFISTCTPSGILCARIPASGS